MSTMFRLTLAALLIFATSASAQDALGSIRELYASASYEEALSALGRMKAAAPTSGLEIDRYRVLCLMALGRGTEADSVIESMVAADPLYQPSAADASPRVRSAFSAVRQRVLPGVARSLYVEAKAAYDRKTYPDAIKALEKTVAVIDSIEAPAKNELADLRVLAAGFLDLSRAAAAPPATAAAPAAATANTETTAAPPATELPRNTPLVVLKQDLPPMPFALTALGTGQYRGMVEVVIDDKGNVIGARMLQSVHAIYDPSLLQAARGWKYEPPRVDGKPTGAVKRVEILLKPTR
jgi:TonB family protein